MSQGGKPAGGGNRRAGTMQAPRGDAKYCRAGGESSTQRLEAEVALGCTGASRRGALRSPLTEEK